jgi:hypothetical protein
MHPWACIPLASAIWYVPPFSCMPWHASLCLPCIIHIHPSVRYLISISIPLDAYPRMHPSMVPVVSISGFGTSFPLDAYSRMHPSICYLSSVISSPLREDTYRRYLLCVLENACLLIIRCPLFGLGMHTSSSVSLSIHHPRGCICIDLPFPLLDASSGMHTSRCMFFPPDAYPGMHTSVLFPPFLRMCVPACIPIWYVLPSSYDSDMHAFIHYFSSGASSSLGDAYHRPLSPMRARGCMPFSLHLPSALACILVSNLYLKSETIALIGLIFMLHVLQIYIV